ncbi:MAG: serine hydrolase, partial [Gemmataceae bacterium]|nr:serine hydrolase [Gemmataceae bacterium]
MPPPPAPFRRALERLEDRLNLTPVPFNAAFQAELEAVLREDNIPQVSFAFSRGDEVFTGGGTNDAFFARSGLAVPADPAADSLLRVASMSKFFTANAILVLQQQGKLSVQDSFLERLGVRRGDSVSGKDPTDPTRDVSARLPDYLFDVTIAQLLQMVSGLPDVVPADSIAFPARRDVYDQPQGLHGSYASLAFAGPPKWTDGPATLEQGNRYYLYQTALAPQGTPAGNPGYVVQPPGTVYDYNNNNFTLLGGVVEHVSGKKYFDFLSEAVLTPLGITTPLAVAPATAERMVGEASADLAGAYPTEVRYYQPNAGTGPSVIPNPDAAADPFFGAFDVPAPYANRSMDAARSAGGLVVTPAAAVTLMRSFSQAAGGVQTGPITPASAAQALARPPGDPAREPTGGWFGFGLNVTPGGKITWAKGGNFAGTVSSLAHAANGTVSSIVITAEPPGFVGDDPDAPKVNAFDAIRELIDKYYLSSKTFEVVGGGDQGAVAGTAFAAPVQVVVKDGLGLPVGTGVPVTFALPAGGPSAGFGGSATVMTGPGGVAIAPPLVANGLVGAYTLTAEVAGFAPTATVADLRNLPAEFLVGAGPGGGPAVQVYSTVTGQPVGSFFAFEPTFAGGVRVAVGDVNNDGYADYVLGAGSGGGPRVRVLSGKDRSPLADFFAFEPTFGGGVYVAAGDVDGDGYSDVVVGAGAGAGPRVTVFGGNGLGVLADFFAFAPTFAGGVTVAAADLDGDGRAEVVAGAGPGGGPAV